VSTQDKNAEMLADFGLTSNQSKVYIATVRLGLASVSQISKASKVRREDVYRTLPKLEKMGLIEKTLGTPTRIRATPLKEALSILVGHEKEKADEKLSALKIKTEALLENFKTNNVGPKLEEEESNFSLITQRDRILNKASNMMKNAEKEIDLVYSRSKLMQFIPAFSEQLKKAMKKNARIRIVTEMPEHEDRIPRIIEEYVSPGGALDLKYTDVPSSHYMTVDYKQAFVATTTEGNMAENPCLWTNSNSLVGILQANFEDLWHMSVGWKTIETNSVPEKVINFMKKLRPTNHVIFVYDSAEAKNQVLFNYVDYGLKNGEAAAYVTSDTSPNRIREDMKRFGIKVSEYEKKHALRVLSYEDIYIIDGKFDLATTVALWKRLYNEALEKGFTGMRVTGEVSCFFKHGLVQELIEYEKALHTVLDIPMIAICAYDAKMLNETHDPVNIYNELVKAHGAVVFKGIDNKLGKIEMRQG
jgi:sugar-specific transcriptional regulator TrmB